MERKIVEQFVLGKGFNAVCRDLGVGSFFDAVRKVLHAYHAANDKYPQTLDEIKSLLGSEVDFSKYDYNPENGTVTLKTN